MIQRILILILLAVSLASADTVYLTGKGKTYHATRACMALARSKNVLTAESADALAHGLHQCGICYRTRTKKTAAPSRAWAKGAK